MPGNDKRSSLFLHTAITVAGALIAIELFIFSISAYYLLLPMAKRATDDLAGLIVLSAKTWVELPPQTRKDFEAELAQKHDLWLFEATSELPEYEGSHPYVSLLAQALAKRIGTEVHIKTTTLEKNWYWVELSVGGRQFRIGFQENIFGMQIPLALLLVMAATIVLTLATAILLARRITLPLKSMADAAGQIGQGHTPALLPETGSRELASLAHAFNQMSQQVQVLLSNRVTLMAGISHDLRTPLTRMRIGLEMLPENLDPKVVERLKVDIEEMSRLIGEFLTFSRGLEKEPPQEIDLQQLLRKAGDDAMVAGVVIKLEQQAPCILMAASLALRRILSNLISNAVRYGNGQPVEIKFENNDLICSISILDRGPGIPPDEAEKVFMPFYRLESSRSVTTGGSGLGLAIAQQLAQVNGWSIMLLPRPGGGTEARLTIPKESVS